jgi:hypothetical protein
MCPRVTLATRATVARVTAVTAEAPPRHAQRRWQQSAGPRSSRQLDPARGRRLRAGDRGLRLVRSPEQLVARAFLACVLGMHAQPRYPRVPPTRRRDHRPASRATPSMRASPATCSCWCRTRLTSTPPRSSRPPRRATFPDRAVPCGSLASRSGRRDRAARRRRRVNSRKASSIQTACARAGFRTLPDLPRARSCSPAAPHDHTRRRARSHAPRRARATTRGSAERRSASSTTLGRRLCASACTSSPSLIVSPGE